MTHILKEHRDGKLESARKDTFKEPRRTSTRTVKEREKERAERKENGVCSDKTSKLLLRK